MKLALRCSLLKGFSMSAQVTCNFAGAAAPILSSSGLALSASELASVFSFALGSIVLGGLLLTGQVYLVCPVKTLHTAALLIAVATLVLQVASSPAVSWQCLLCR